LDAPVSGGVEGAKNGTLAMMVGGDMDALEKPGPYWKPWPGVSFIWVLPAASSHQAVNQIMCAGINSGVTEASLLHKPKVWPWISH